MNDNKDEDNGDEKVTLVAIGGGLFTIVLVVLLMALGMWKVLEMLGAALYAVSGS